MDLLYITDHRYIKSKNGDIFTTGQMNEKYFDRFSESFDHVTVLGFCEEESKKNSRKVVEKVNLEDVFVTYHLVPTSGTIWGRIDSLKKLKQEFEKIMPRFDRVATKAPSLISEYAVKYCNKNNVPSLVELVGCPWNALWNHSLMGKLAAPFLWLSTRKAVWNASYVIYVTEQFLQKGYPTKGINTACSDVVLFSSPEEVIEKRLSKIGNRKKTDPIILGTIAAIDVKYKGQEYVIKAISILNKKGFNFEYHIVGNGDTRYLNSIIEKYHIADKVKLLGALPHHCIFEYIDQIDIYVQPSKTEGLPRALIEAMSRGCPAIGSEVGGIGELLEKHSLFQIASVDKLIVLLRKMNRKKMVSEAKRNFEKAKEYQIERLNQRRKAFYQMFSENPNKIN